MLEIAEYKRCSPRIRCELGARCAWCCSSVWYQLLLWHKAIPGAQPLSFKREALMQRAVFVIHSVTSLLLTYCGPVYFFSRFSATDKLLCSRVLYEHINFIPFLGLLKRIVTKLDSICVMIGRIIGVSMNGCAALLSLGNWKQPRARQRRLQRH